MTYKPQTVTEELAEARKEIAALKRENALLRMRVNARNWMVERIYQLAKHAYETRTPLLLETLDVFRRTAFKVHYDDMDKRLQAFEKRGAA